VEDFVQLLVDPPPERFFVGLGLWLGIALLACLLSLSMYGFLRQRGYELVPRQRRRAVPWTIGEVIGAWAIYLLAVPVCVQFLTGAGFFRFVYGDAVTGDSAGRLLGVRQFIWASPIAIPFQLAGIVGLLCAVSGTRPYQLGLTLHRAGRNIVLGFLTWLAAVPLILAFNLLVTFLYEQWFNATPEKHALEELGRSHPLVFEWVLLVVSAVIVAPILEELVFRGVLLRWLSVHRQGADGVMAVALLLALTSRASMLEAAIQSHDAPTLQLALQPMLFVLVAAVGYVGIRLRRYGAQVGAIYASAMLFAVIHPDWPAPIPLFVLGLVLGWLAYRTQSLVAPIVLHALFNGVACTQLLAG
jgi:membrane protease YdiL (CAAX protease family)